MGDAAELPRNTEELQKMVLDLQDRTRSLERQVLVLEEKNALLVHKIFGRLSEKLSREDERQALLFNEAEATAAQEAVEPEEATITVASHQRRSRGRRPLPADLPREERLHDLSAEEKICGCGAERVRIGEESSEELELVPARAVVVRHVRPKYACRSCEGAGRGAGEAVVSIAEPPLKLIPKSIATSSLLAFVASAKFCDGLPLARQEKQFARLGVDISRADLSNWMIRAGSACSPLIALLQSDLRGGPVVGVDETPVQVHQEPGRANTSESRMWVFRGGPPGKPILLYQYHPTRSGEVPLLYLSGYRGYLQTDDYGGYDALAAEPAIVHVGCWAHARRKFVDAQKGGKKAGSAEVALSYIGSLYRTERQLRERLAANELSEQRFAELRRRAVIPELRKLRDWFRAKLPQVPPETLLGKALFYLHHEWPKLLRYLCSPYLTPDNNAVERAIRPFVVGRKAWLFAGCPAGAHASAALYSLIETAKANGLEPYFYLRYIFSRLPFAQTETAYRALLPYHLTRAEVTTSS